MNNSSDHSPDYDAIVVGTGVCGIFQAYRLQELGFRWTAIERGADVGGTWYWNRYPGCRFDSESETYGYLFSRELFQEWTWKERFAPREETERYLQHVVEKYGLRRHMQFNCTVTSARWDEDCRFWKVALSDGRSLSTRFLLTALGFLSAPTLPRYPGVDRFRGASFHTYHAPKDPIDYRGKRVAVIGTGSTGVQVICEIADKVASLTVFQRRPNWCAPLNNAAFTVEETAELKDRYEETLEACRATPSGYFHSTVPTCTFEVPKTEREAFWEKLYAGRGFGVWLGNYKDVLTDPAANAEYSKFIANKIRQRIKDPALAEKMIPTDHGFGTRRVPMERSYYEAFNRENVELIDLEATPIKQITEAGVETTTKQFPFDIIVYATGFDAIIGSYEKLNVVGRDGLRLMDKWKDGPRTVFGIAVPGFPNLFTLAGPQSGSVATNFPRGIEDAVNWSSNLLAYLRNRGCTRIEAAEAAEVQWLAEVQKWSKRILFGQENSWFTGYNTNVDRKRADAALIYAGGQIRYRKILAQQADSGYPAFDLQ
jgi:cation diffusion facilitator CzcD-associated flavoprotein CzcO